MGLVDIKGLQKTSLIDYPPYIVSTVFLARCNFQCPFCHNPDIVKDYSSMKDISEEDFFNNLIKRKGLIDGVCITGGEPTLYKGLPSFIKKIRDLRFLVKLDTNGTNPGMLKLLIEEKLVNHVAMDIKSPKEKYQLITHSEIDIKKIEESVELLKQGKVNYEFRMTVVPGLFSKEDAIKIGLWLEGAERFFIQQFVSNTKLIDRGFENKKPFAIGELEEFRKILSSYIKKVDIRGI